MNTTIFNNNNRITFGSFLAYFVMSAIISPLGVVSGPIAEHFSISLTAANASFTFLTSGVFSTTVAGMLLARHFHWSSAYLLAFVVSLSIAVIAIVSHYPDTERSAASRETSAVGQRWPISVHVIGLSMLVYLVGFVTIYSWVPNYAQHALGLSVEASSEVVSRMFLGMFIGQLIMFFLVLKFRLRTLIVVYAIMATLLTVSLWSVASSQHLQIAMLGLGLATGGLFKTMLSYGTTAVSDPSPKMVSYLIFYAGLGTAIAPFVGSLVVEQFEMVAALQFATLCYGLTLGLILVAIRVRGT